MKRRTRQFALDVLALVERLPRREPVFAISRQLTKSATSVAANYRASCRARSRSEFVARIGVVCEEADESELWLDLIGASHMLDARAVAPLRREANELIAIFAASYGTAKRNAGKAADF